jgi:ABC-type microcin C transport system permease subunit YejE
LIGVTAGAFQGFYGGKVDLIAQRVIESGHLCPSLYILIIFSAMFVPGFWTLLLILLLFSWTHLVDVVRAEFLRAPLAGLCARRACFGCWKFHPDAPPYPPQCRGGNLDHDARLF